MSRKKKKTALVKWEKQSYDHNRNELPRLVVKALWDAFSVSLMVISAVLMIGVFVDDVRVIYFPSFFKLEIEILLLCFLISVRLPMFEDTLKNGRLRLRARLAIFVPVLMAGLFIFMKYRDIKGRGFINGELLIAGKYIEAYNRVMGRSYYVPMAVFSRFETLRAISFWSIVVVFVFFMLYFLTRKRWVFLFIPGVALTLVMIIGLAPSWPSMILMIVGFYTVAGIGMHLKYLPQCLAALVLYVLIFAASGVLFRNAADDLLENSGKIKDIQEKLEAGVNNFFSGITSVDSQRIDNSKPKYKDSDVMTVEMSRYPGSNIYFREYYGTSYSGGLWRSDRKKFEEDCKEAGFDLEFAWEQIEGRRRETGIERTANFKISYDTRLSKMAYLPYGIDADDLDDFELEGDTTAYKEMTDKTVRFSALNVNSIDERDMSLISNKSMSREEEKFWRWYNDYVTENYLDSASRNFDGVMLSGFVTGMANKHDNDRRLELAQMVADYLDENYEYSWNLDTLKSGQDPVDYFLSKGKKGYCVHFASAAVFLLQHAGVPARYVSGYVAKPYLFDKTDDGFEVDIIDRNGHAWVEIYLEYIGWVPVEVTPGFSEEIKEMPTGKKAQQKREAKLTPTVSPTLTEEPTESPTVTAAETATPTITKEPRATLSPDDTPTPAAPKATKTPKPTKGGTASSSGKGSDGDGSGDSKLPRIFITVLLIVLAVSLAAGGIGIALGRVKKNRALLENELKQKKYRRAIFRMNRRIYKQLKVKSGTAGYIKDDEYEKKLRLTYPGIGKNDWTSYMNIVKKAAFSQEEFTEDEVSLVCEIYEKIISSPHRS